MQRQQRQQQQPFLTLRSAPGTFSATPPATAAAWGSAALRWERLMSTEPTRMEVAPTHHCRLVASPNTALPRRPVALMLTALQAGQCMQADQGRRGPGAFAKLHRMTRRPPASRRGRGAGQGAVVA